MQRLRYSAQLIGYAAVAQHPLTRLDKSQGLSPGSIGPKPNFKADFNIATVRRWPSIVYSIGDFVNRPLSSYNVD